MRAPQQFKNKNVLVLGLGVHGGGVGTVEFLARQGAHITVTDLRTRKELTDSLYALRHFSGIRYVLGKHREKDVLRSDLVVKNPGVPPHSPFLWLAEKNNIPITSDIGIFFRLCPTRHIIGITGTRGKSTTTALITIFLKTGNRRVFSAGNIRRSVLELLPKLKKDDWVVLELSSFQLEDLSREQVSPPTAVMTNILRDHLNWHQTMTAYIKAKSNIFAFQKPNDLLFYNPLDVIVTRMAKRAPSKQIPVRLPKPLQSVVDERLGAQYRAAAALARAVGAYYGVSQTTILKSLKRFKGLEGRQEILSPLRGIHVVNDTTSTMPDATMAALKRFSNKKRKNERLILIAGGQDKNLDFRQLIPVMRRRAAAIIFLPGTATEIVAKKVKKKELFFAYSMDDAVQKAFGIAKKGDWIILSPGAASFGLFLNEFDRGKKFIESLQKIKNITP